MTALYILYFLLLALIVYSYFGYPVLLRGCQWVSQFWGSSSRASGEAIHGASLERSGSAAEPDSYPSVTLLVAVHNEEIVLPSKLANIELMDYPGALDVLFVLDGTTDRSPDIIDEAISKPSKFVLRRFSTIERNGKEAALRQAIATVSSEVLAFSDADSIYQPDTIRLLVEALMKPGVGAACGHEHHVAPNALGAGEGEGLFYRYENYLKKLLTGVCSLTYIQGGVFAMHRANYPANIAKGLTQDGVIAFTLVLKGLKVVFVEDAVSTEEYTLTTAQDFKRRTRTITRAFASVLAYWQVLLPWKTGVFGFHLLSHRVLRWFVLPMMFALFILNLFLLQSGWFYQVMLVCQILFYGFAALGWFLECRKVRVKLFYVPYYFCYLHAAAGIAIFQVIMGKRVATWSPTQRQSPISSLSK